MVSAGNLFLQWTDWLVSQIYVALPCEIEKLNKETVLGAGFGEGWAQP